MLSRVMCRARCQPGANVQPESGWVWLRLASVYVVVALLLSWPLPALLFSHLPLGTLPDPVVPWFNLWTLEWNADRLLHGYAGYWNAPLFYPTQHSFALSEPQGLTGLVFAGFRGWVGPIAAYNLTLISLLVCNALAARRLARVVGMSCTSAVCVGVLVLALPFVQRELGVIQLCAMFPVLCALAELRALLVDGDARAVVRLALCLAATVWTCVYYALFLALLLPAALPFALRRGLPVRSLLAAASIGALLVVALCWPVYRAQQRAVAGFTRSASVVHAGSASVWAYLQPPQRSTLGGCTKSWARSAQSRTLYPGAITTALALLGARRARRAAGSRFVAFCGVALGLCLLLSFGTRLKIGALLPYELLVQRVVPGFAQLRSPYRAAVFVQLLLTLFAGFGLDAVAQASCWSKRALRHAAPVICTCFALAELYSGAQRMQRFPYETLYEPWIGWLSHQPPGAAAMVPPVASPKAGAYASTVLGMLQALGHGHPLVNGYSGFFPPDAERVVLLLRRFPDASSLRMLREHGVRYVIVDKRWVAEYETALRAVSPADLTLEYDAPTRLVFLLREAPDGDVHPGR
jgi:hypothetical protein